MPVTLPGWPRLGANSRDTPAGTTKNRMERLRSAFVLRIRQRITRKTWRLPKLQSKRHCEDDKWQLQPKIRPLASHSEILACDERSLKCSPVRRAFAWWWLAGDS